MALSILVGCADSEDTVDLDFQSSDCKSKRAQPAALRLGTSLEESGEALGGGPEYEGLNCFAWTTRPEGGLRIDVYNFTGNCGAGLEGRAERNGTALELFVRPKGCAVAACGSCVYDVAFELADVPTNAPLEVALTYEYCNDEAPKRPAGALTLPLDERPAGTICRTGACSKGIGQNCGVLHCPPCASEDGGFNNSCGTAEAPGCDPELVCDDRAGHKSCLAPCTSNADCLMAIESCESGVCRLRETFE